MASIMLKNNLLFYYGNPAGYILKDVAVVDCIFQTEELINWLTSRNMTPDWTVGVFEKLHAGADGENFRVPELLKHVRIWQLKPDVDVHIKFISYEELVRQFGTPDKLHYHVVYDGTLDTNNLEAIYNKCNLNHPSGYSGHSLSMSDIIELYDETESQFHYVDRFGFQQIDFEPQEEKQNMRMEM